jgi:drug/metabolite transporter (DMT)-like permease
LASIVLMGLWPWLPGKSPQGKDLIKAVVMGVIVFVLAPRLQVEGVHQGMAGDASVLVAFDPLITSLAAALFLGERIATRRWVGFGFGMIGVVLLAQIWRTDYRPLAGLTANLLFISSFVCETAYSVIGKPILERVSLVKLLGVALISATVVNLFLDGRKSVAAAGALPWSVWLLLIYLAVICTLAGYILWYVAIRETEVNVIALTVFIQPVMGWSVSVVALGEPAHWGQAWGTLAIVTGLWIGLRRPGKPRFELPPPN